MSEKQFVCQSKKNGYFRCVETQLQKTGYKCPSCGASVNTTTYVEVA